jgi:hypothetical protein
MFLFLILPILVSGFLCCHLLPNQKYKLYRLDGQYLYLKSAQFGLFCLLLVTIPCIILDKFLPSEVPCIGLPLDIMSLIESIVTGTEIVSGNQITQLSWVLLITVLMMIVPFCLAKLQSKLLPKFIGTKKIKEYMVGSVLDDSPLDSALYSALTGKSCVMLSLSDNKVYVCKIVSMGEPNEREGPDQEIVIAPIMSGYRTTETKKVEFVTYYEEQDEDKVIVVRQDLISYFCGFDFDTYNRLNAPKKPSEKVKKFLRSL